MACDPAKLVDDARCIECAIPPGMQWAVLISLFCQIRDDNSACPITQSAQFPLNDAVPLNTKFAHGLTVPPTYLRGVLLCTTNDAGTGVTVGTEVGLESVFAGNSSQLCGYGADGTFIYASSLAGVTGMISWLGVSSNMTSLNHFSLKLYWHA